jgi:tetratricopeptide (TPR) repeat protein
MDVPSMPTPSLQAIPAAAGLNAGVSPAADQERLILIPLEGRALRLLAMAVALGVAAWLALALLRPALADRLAGGAADRRALERALAWQPGNAELHRRLAQVYEADGQPGAAEQAERHVVAALRQLSASGAAWLQLALHAERQGDRQRARLALHVALELDPHNVNLRWEAALLALRWDDRDAALTHLRYLLAVDAAHCNEAFQVASAILDPDVPPTSLLPAEAAPLEALLQLAVRDGDLPLAQAAWERRAALEPAPSPGLQRRYLEFLLHRGEAARARQLWLQIVPDGVAGTPHNLVWNGGFEQERLRGWGFDWQVRRMWGVQVSLDRSVAARGRQSLRLTFNSFPTLDFAGVHQFIAVEPGGEYRLRALAKAFEFTTQAGLKLQVATPDGERVLAETPAIAGTTAGWVPLETQLQVPPDTPLVILRLRREKAPGPEGNLGGKVWLDEVTLTPVGGTTG